MSKYFATYAYFARLRFSKSPQLKLDVAMEKKPSKPGKIHLRIIEAMRRFPEGITSGQIRQELGLRADEQAHLDKRRRELKRWYVIRQTKSNEVIDGKKRAVTRYIYVDERTDVTDEGSISLKTRAEILRDARGRCGMCGRSIDKHDITLVIDHKIPRDWGGSNDPENLWAICEDCNAGKKAFFSSLNVDAALMKRVTSHQSVHVRIGELLKAVGVGKQTPSFLLEIVAAQDDWQKRLRDLRYPVIGWKIESKTYKSSGKKQADYILRSYEPWPEDPSGIIRRFEQARKRRNLVRKSD
jgi:5-methylcytosine-specific restriction endonuclease McrA